MISEEGDDVLSSLVSCVLFLLSPFIFVRKFSRLPRYGFFFLFSCQGSYHFFIASGGGDGFSDEVFCPHLKKSRRKNSRSYGGIKLTPLEKFIAAVVSDDAVRRHGTFGYGDVVGMECA